MSVDAESGRHPASDDRVDELPERSVDDDSDHVHNSHDHILRGHGTGRAAAKTHGMRFGAGDLPDVHRGADEPDFRVFLSEDLDFVLSDFHAHHSERIPGMFVVHRSCPNRTG